MSNFIQSNFSIQATCKNLINCKTGLNVGGNTRDTTFPLIWQPCCKISCMFFFPFYCSSNHLFCTFLYSTTIVAGMVHCSSACHNKNELCLQYTTKNAYFYVCCKKNGKGIQSILVFDFSLQNFLAVVSRKIT